MFAKPALAKSKKSIMPLQELFSPNGFKNHLCFPLGLGDLGIFIFTPGYEHKHKQTAELGVAPLHTERSTFSLAG